MVRTTRAQRRPQVTAASYPVPVLYGKPGTVRRLRGLHVNGKDSGRAEEEQPQGDSPTAAAADAFRDAGETTASGRRLRAPGKRALGGADQRARRSRQH